MGDDTNVISVVMPAHNEESLLAAAVNAVTDAMVDRGPFEVLVVENGSTDATLEIAQRLSGQRPEVRALRESAPDYGLALRAGLLAAKGETVAIFDVDYYDFGFLDSAVALVEAPDGPVIVVATKRGEGSLDTRAWPRRLVTAGFSTMLKVGFGLKVSDTHGMKVLRREPILHLVEACRFGTDIFDTELVLRVERAGMKVTEIPVTVAEMRPSRTSMAKRIPRTLANLVRLRRALDQECRRPVRTN